MITTAATEILDIWPQAGGGTSSTVDVQPISEALFEFLATSYPSRLFDLIQFGQLSPTQLTFAAEWAGRAAPKQRAKLTLLPLLRHPSPVVREGAIYGLELVQELPGVRQAILTHSQPEHESSPGVRAAALDALELDPY
jgi:hypothetical protein